ncbi:hypothetical protein ACEN9J_01080 [Variovorax sp. Varisp41]|uniref:hypothetical protein n=1 Tax=Variovorax sp. Varisp41 TaxID=3243033 RepID=UPI0039B3C389
MVALDPGSHGGIGNVIGVVDSHQVVGQLSFVNSDQAKQGLGQPTGGGDLYAVLGARSRFIHTF